MPEARERMQEETEIREALRVENLTKTFPGGVVADDNVSITVREGEVHGLELTSRDYFSTNSCQTWDRDGASDLQVDTAVHRDSECGAGCQTMEELG